MIEIPLTNDPAQTFTIAIEDVIYSLRVSFNTRAGYWTADFSTSGTPLIMGIPLLGGVDIVQQYNIPLTNMFVVNTAQPNQDATVDNLGDIVKLVLLTDEELTFEPEDEQTV
jgi:hypothetical protein